MIVIDGQIGVGKTTLGEILERALNIPLASELTNQDTLQILERFYDDKKRWSFTSQTHFLVNRLQMIKNIAKSGSGILDRSLFGDKIFATILYEEGNMSTEEYNTYNYLMHSILELAPLPTHLVFLDCDTDVALSRIKKRNRSCEKNIAPDYINKINMKYKAWFEEYNLSPKLRIDTNDIDPYREIDRSYLIDLIRTFTTSC